ncbi:putative deoxyribodipyrimidine photo-lyase Phr1 [Gamsiella multidivaricata]|uniref:putative deoxyribodipyrimidine photo-lyase Phr1 n=1 Tax=Gamsiella multidivaricata TaxID=101098 RepID=UPI00221FC39C|nr:putative deoxyribodipyrimidine photo-lyase Phr1 [Gamsiella multidivaricata]KAI7827497.1 putative deoxyribodipyrimidine photo-lyase Phr1 [Gamsiella multidivaricata]
MWFRNDLRLQDNRALYGASMRSKVGARCLIALYIISEEEWEEHDEAAVKIDFWMRNLASLKTSLDKLAIPLVVKTAKHKTDVVGVVESVVREMDISHVFWNAELMIDERRRDAAVRKRLLKISNVRVEECDDQCVVNPLEVRTKTGNPYAVFTPFYNTWCKLVETEPHYLELSEAPDENPPEARELYVNYFKADVPSSHPHDLDIDEVNRLYPAGEEEAHNRVHAFIKTKGKVYHEGRNTPFQEGTSVMSPYISSGIISVRQCIVLARVANNNKITTGNEGLKFWIKELGWREFYRNILVCFPRVCMNRAFQLKTEKVQWDENEENFQRWCDGKTGFPIVDAGMRQLNSIGFMHNRLRMITACFLVKDLLIDWHKGERYFMQRLIDGDLASNNGGWQWSASTGTDAQPYFRVFNPLLQSQRFDPKGEYIRKWIPELRGLNDKQIHEPYHALPSKEFLKLGYPTPIVDHAAAKKKYVDEFKRVLALDQSNVASL